MKKIYSVLLLLSAITVNVFAQQLPFSNQYSFNSFTLSSLYAGLNGKSDVSASYCHELVGISGSPIVKTIALNTTAGKSQGLGLNIIADQTGVFRNSYAIGNYVYHLPISKDAIVSFGMNAGLYNNFIDITNIEATTSTAILQSQRGQTFFAGAGLLATIKNFNIGIELPSLYTSKATSYRSRAINEYILRNNFQAHISYVYALTDKVRLNPIFVMKQTINTPIVYVASTLIRYKEKVSMLIGYRNSNTVQIGIGYRLHENVVINYVYGLGFSGIAAESKGMHEVGIAIAFGKHKENLAAANNEINDSIVLINRMMLQKIDSLQSKTVKLSHDIDSLKNNLPIQSTKNDEAIITLNTAIDALKGQLQNLTEKKTEIKNTVIPQSTITSKSIDTLKTVNETAKGQTVKPLKKGYYIIVQSSALKDRLIEDVQLWKSKGYKAVLTKNAKGKMYYIAIAHYTNRVDANSAIRQLQKKTALPMWLYKQE